MAPPPPPSYSILLREEEEAPQARGRGGAVGGGPQQAGPPQEEEEGHLRPEETPLLSRRLHARELAAGSNPLWLSPLGLCFMPCPASAHKLYMQ